MGRDLPTPLEEVVDRDVQDFPKPPDWDDAEWSSLRERARHLLAKPIRPTQDLLDAIEPELLENNYTLQAFTWVPRSLETANPTDAPTNELMAEFHADESRAPLAAGMVSRFFASKCDGEVGPLMVVFHPPGFGPWCVRGAFLTDVNSCDVWAPRLPEHGIVNGRGQPLQYQAVVGNSRIKVWRDWLADLRSVLDSYPSSSEIRVLVPWELSALIGSIGRALGDEISIEVVEFQSESTFFHIEDDWSPVPLQLVWRRLARGLSVLLEEGASRD